MKSTRGILALAFALATAVVLVGCAATATTAEPSAQPSVIATSTPSAVPTPTPTPAVKPTLAQLVVSADGIDSLVIGAPVTPEPTGFDLARFIVKHCDNTDADIGLWEPTYPGTSFRLVTNPQTATGDIRMILVTSTKLATATGVHVGSALSELKAAYPAFDKVITEPSTTLYILNGTHGKIAFEVARQFTYGTAKTPYWSEDQVDRVQFMSIWSLRAKPIAYSGIDMPGGCA